MSTEPNYEIQLTAMRAVMEALKPLDESGREAVLGWVDSQLGRKAKGLVGRPLHETIAAESAKTEKMREGTVSVVAQKIGAASARELLLAAATHLTLFQGKDVFTKDELVACAKEARNWKADYSNQMETSNA